jgi:hypothetical protein
MAGSPASRYLAGHLNDDQWERAKQIPLRGLAKTGGRQKGISNLHCLKPDMTNRELRAHVAEICAQRGFDPISTMCLIGKNRKIDEKSLS